MRASNDYQQVDAPVPVSPSGRSSTGRGSRPSPYEAFLMRLVALARILIAVMPMLGGGCDASPPAEPESDRTRCVMMCGVNVGLCGQNCKSEDDECGRRCASANEACMRACASGDGGS